MNKVTTETVKQSTSIQTTYFHSLIKVCLPPALAKKTIYIYYYNSMKKFFLTLFILLALGGTGFFFGWVQLAVPLGSYGIITSKTHGVDPVPVRSGDFRWLWYKLIPTNVQIAVFRLEPARFEIRFNNTLPSGDSYAAFAGIGADFSWELMASVSFSIDPDMLVSIVSRQNLTSQEDLNAYLQYLAQIIEIIIMRTFASVETDNERLENILAGNADEELEREIARRYPEIQNFTFNVRSARFPDFALYRQVRLLYEEFLAQQREVIVSGFGGHAESHIAAQLRLNELESYGGLLTRFPILLDFLAMEMNQR
jgi:hypothetical protein